MHRVFVRFWVATAVLMISDGEEDLASCLVHRTLILHTAPRVQAAWALFFFFLISGIVLVIVGAVLGHESWTDYIVGAGSPTRV